MPLSADERARIIETQTLKSEVNADIAAGVSKPKLSEFQKQIVLLAVGFALTAIAGGALTYYWKSRDWSNQQSYLRQQRALDKKYAVVETMFKDVAVTTAAAQNVLISYYQPDVTPQEIDERARNWQKTSRDWRVSSKILSASLAANFQDPHIGNTFRQIIDVRRQLGNKVTNLPKCKPGAKVKQKTIDNLKDANDLANQIVELLQKCGALMTSEIKAGYQ
jgi:hypothetical protein